VPSYITVVIVFYRRFGTIYRSLLQGSSSLGLTPRSVKCKKTPVLIFVAAEDWNPAYGINWNLFGKQPKLSRHVNFFVLCWLFIVKRETAVGRAITRRHCHCARPSLAPSHLTLPVTVVPECRRMNHRFTPTDVTPDVQSSLISWVGEGKGQTVPRLLSVLVTRDLQGIERMRAGGGMVITCWRNATQQLLSLSIIRVTLPAAEVPAANSVSYQILRFVFTRKVNVLYNIVTIYCLIFIPFYITLTFWRRNYFFFNFSTSCI